MLRFASILILLHPKKNEPTRRYLGSTLLCGIYWASCSKSQFALFLVEPLGIFFAMRFFMDLRCLLSEVSLVKILLVFSSRCFPLICLECLVSCQFLFLCGAVIQLFPHEIHN